MNTGERMIRTIGCIGLLAMVACGCQSNGEAGLDKEERAEPSPRAARAFPPITLDGAAYPRLGDAVRQIGETTGGGVVLLAGMEEFPVAPVQLNATGFVGGLKQLVGNQECKFQIAEEYVFLYPPGYEQLVDLSVTEYLPNGFASGRANFAVGAGTRLPNALALLSDAFDTAVVADNVVAEAWCGELFLEDADFADNLEAVLKSALIVPSAINIASSDNYVFIRSTDNVNQAPALLNPGEVSQRQRSQLAATVNVRLPASEDGVAFAETYMPLAQVLPVLATQLGVEITADPAMDKFPVDAAVLNGVSVETALNLIVWQWPLPRFGYRATPVGFHFCPREG